MPKFVISEEVCTLVITEAFPEDSGIFKCVAENEFGSAASSARLSVSPGKHMDLWAEQLSTRQFAAAQHQATSQIFAKRSQTQTLLQAQEKRNGPKMQSAWVLLKAGCKLFRISAFGPSSSWVKDDKVKTMFSLTEESHPWASPLQASQLSPTHWLNLYLVYCNTWLAWLVLRAISKQNSTLHVTQSSPALVRSQVWLMQLCRFWSMQTPGRLNAHSPAEFPFLLPQRAVLVTHHCFLPDLWTILPPGAKELESFAGAAHRPAVQVTMKKPTFPRNSQTGAKDRDAAGLPSYSTETPGLGSRAEATNFGQMNSKSEAEDFHGAYKNSPQASPLR